MASSQVPESFRSLLLRDRGRTGLIQRDLAAQAAALLALGATEQHAPASRTSVRTAMEPLL